MTETAKPRGSKHDGRTTFFVVLASLLIIGGLRVASIDRASSRDQGHERIPTPVATSAEGCDTWANYWTNDSGVGASQSALEGMSNCRLGEDGHWIVPGSANDTRWPNAPILTKEEIEQTVDLRQAILDEIDGLEAKFPDGLRDQLAKIYDGTDRPVVGHIKDTQPISTTRSRYARVTQAYLMSPDSVELAEYVGWLMANRQSSFADFLRSCEREELQYLWFACRGLGDSLSIFFPPFPWDLNSSYNLDSYLKWALDNGKVPAAPKSIPQTSS